jgi:RNA polymerase sigma factor (sigma-70 family)
VPSATSTPADARRAGAEALAERLYSLHRPQLLALARANSGDRDDAEEALQDAFLLFIERFDPAAGSPPLPWLTLTLKRRCWALYGQRRRRAHPADQVLLEHAAEDSPRSPEELCEVGEKAARLRHDFAVLKPDQRQALTLLALGYSYREIAAACGWTRTKVNRCLAEGRAALRAASARTGSELGGRTR